MNAHQAHGSLTAGHRGYELDLPETLHDHAFREEIEEALEAAGAAPDKTLFLGATGGGEDNLLLTWSDNGYALAEWAIQEAELTSRGTFTEFVTGFAQAMRDEEDPPGPDDYSAELHPMLVASGVFAAEPEAAPDSGGPGWQPVQLPDGISQHNPVVLSEEEAPHCEGEFALAKDRLRLSDGTVIGYCPPEVVVFRHGERLAFPVPGTERIVPSPSGTRLSVFKKKGEIREHGLDGSEAIVDAGGAAAGRDCVVNKGHWFVIGAVA